MTDFSTKWETSGINKDYLDIADIILQDRYKTIDLLISYINHFKKSDSGIKVLDLGCGDGVLTKCLYSKFPEFVFTVVDGSDEMLKKAKQNLLHIENCNFLKATFDDIQNNDIKLEMYDFFVSSFAIHHIEHNKKYRFFETVYSLLNADGHFINIDTCLSSNSLINKWYYGIWTEWIRNVQEKIYAKNDYSNVPTDAPNKPENHYQDLNEQLNWLNDIGFKNVDCHYKNGIFCLYGGQK